MKGQSKYVKNIERPQCKGFPDASRFRDAAPYKSPFVVQTLIFLDRQLFVNPLMRFVSGFIDDFLTSASPLDGPNVAGEMNQKKCFMG